MAAGDVIEDIKNKLVCAICADVLKDPRVLSCGHTFCFECIWQDYQRLQLKLGKCPLCREPYYLKKGDIHNLSRNFSVNDVLDTLRSAGRARVCAVCQEDGGIYVCLTCKLNLCKHCSKYPNITWIECSHQVLHIDDMNSLPFLRDVIQLSRAKQTCPIHSEEDASYMCHTCKRVMCNACRLQGHIHHDIQGIKESVKKLCRKNIPSLLETKTRDFDKTIDSLSCESSFNRNPSRRVEIREEMRRYRSQRQDCSDFHRDMCHLFKCGSDKTILEVFHRREHKINEILNTPTQSVCKRWMVYIMYCQLVRMICRSERSVRQYSAIIRTNREYCAVCDSNKHRHKLRSYQGIPDDRSVLFYIVLGIFMELAILLFFLYVLR
ncbi:tripartite motif-containing protein 45-like [Pecten maximus]|uniref:tripartite motif-containing protein 45-like n=1 Tax=Pecten maximus TaxID=6579 RepID=UPI0014587391|nr:tripartite motif-containing protein 45-like [Pecten maximus]